MLGWLQSDIAANAIRPEGRVLAAHDRSVQVHACHGPARQVDVLREVLLGLLDDDPTLEPRDIVVMCPDIETYAPLIVASFGLGETAADSHPAHRLRVKLADRALNQTNPLLAVAAALLAIAGPAPPPARCSTWRRLRRCGPVPVQRRRPRRDHRLGAQCQYPLGFDQCHRRPYGLGDIVHNTWRFGLDRILTGVAMSDDSRAWLGTALPLDDVGSDRVELAGRLAEYVDQLHDVVEKLSGAKPLTQWLEALSEGVGMLTEPQDAWQQAQLQREFTKVLAQADLGNRRCCACPMCARCWTHSWRATDPGELSHRHADGVHDGADALGAASGGVPGRARRRGVSATARTGRRRRAGPLPDDR
ncbi:exodeoxyribonuclease V, gamma subunit [Mycobacterium xenopi 4042]|uniref:Exodeoxyribonuclease V, gamma subunit n=1 Tax=Mycobacterium xenopi 4042 TaxID=1299334 RepID=X7YJ23_MYCXE|nr:exodeoxyribonuclease V, gamma subunit [Mycobacterium xenopi 4042]